MVNPNKSHQKCLNQKSSQIPIKVFAPVPITILHDQLPRPLTQEDIPAISQLIDFFTLITCAADNVLMLQREIPER